MAMSRSSELAARLSELADPALGDFSTEIAQVIKPNPDAGQRDSATIVGAVRGGREALEALFSECLVADRLAAILGQTQENHARIHALLNAPFPPRKDITVEFLDLLVARIQHLETFVRLLAAALVETQYPAERSPVNYVSESSANRRRA
jgi:hypothetical protein